MATKHTPKAGTTLPMDDRHVNMSNALARASHALSLAEKRVIACGIANTNSVGVNDFNMSVLKGGGWVIKVTAAEFKETFGLSEVTAYEQLAYVAKTLTKRDWQTIEPSKRKGKSIITRYPWVARSKYHEGEGWIELEFTHYTAPHLLALKKNFTSYKLSNGSALRSLYSWRLMECLASWKSTGVWHVPIDDFHHAMDTTASHKKDFGMLRRSVIDPAVRELRDTQNLQLDYKVIKTGRKVASLIFEFEPSRQQQLDL
jgi:plasmid replication initiation protein